MKQRVRDSTWPPAGLGASHPPAAAAKIAQSHVHAARAYLPNDFTICAGAAQIPAANAGRHTKAVRGLDARSYAEGASDMCSTGKQVLDANADGWASCHLQPELPDDFANQALHDGVTVSPTTQAELLDSAQTLSLNGGNPVTSTYGAALTSNQVKALMSGDGNVHGNVHSTRPGEAPGPRLQSEPYVREPRGARARGEEVMRGDFLRHGCKQQSHGGGWDGSDPACEDFAVRRPTGTAAWTPHVNVRGAALAPPVTLHDLSLIDPDLL